MSKETMVTMWCGVLCLFAIAVRGVLGDLATEMAEATQQCCNQGTQYARTHTSEECSSSIPPDVKPVFGTLCLFAMDQCCREYFTKKYDCETGIHRATTGTCSDPNIAKRDCCTECRRGSVDGAAAGSCAVNSTGTSAEELLSADAYAQCCKKAYEEKKNTEVVTPHEEPSSKRPILSIMPSLCEEYAPNELCAHHCIPVPGSYKCECNPGFMLMPDGRNCIEVVQNRCKQHNPCEYKCNDNGVEVKCSCKRGYELMADGTSCQDIDECAVDPPVCLPGTQCHNIRGSYRCIPKKNNHTPPEKGQCPPGYARNLVNGACDDINECALPHPPCPAYLCENTIGGYKCGGMVGDPANLATSSKSPMEDRCPPGFKAGFNEECEDVDECATKKDDCNRISQFCINTLGSFHCQDKVSKHCPPGFKIDPKTNKCEDINECEDSEDICKADQICVNELGQYDCKPKVDPSRTGRDCPYGMRLKQGTSICEDIDECVEGTHICDQYHYCLNTNGSHECHCKLGYEKDPITGACIDINECATGQHNCIPESQRCDNTVGSFLCIRFTSCGTGYILHHSSGKCEDIDECVLEIHNCARAGPEYHCVNHPGSFRCVRKKPPTTSTTSTTPQPIYEYYYDSEEDIGEENETNPEAPATTTTAKPEAPSEPPTPKPTEAPSQPESSPKPEPTSPDDSINEIIPPQPTEPTDKRVATPIYDNDYESRVTIHAHREPVTESPPEIKTVHAPREFPDESPIEQEPVTEPAESRKEEPKLSQPERPSPTYSPYNPDRPQPTYRPYQPEEPKPTNPPLLPERPKSEPSPNINESVQPEPTEPDLETTYSPVQSSPTPPSVVYVEVGKDTAIVNGEKKNDGSVVVDTKNIPKDEWTKIKEKPTDCLAGFQSDEYGACYDIDECTTNQHTCLNTSQVCKNTMGGYVCECALGYRRDLYTGHCVPIPTTSSSTTTSTTTPPPTTTTEKLRTFWGYPEYRPRTVRPFRSRSSCDVGFHLNSKTRKCEDVNECTNGQANCAAVEICVNTDGGYRCECPPNWHLDEVKHRCVPNRSYGQFPSGYGNEPVYTPIEQTPYRHDSTFGAGAVEPKITRVNNGGSVIKCPRGYSLGDDHICEDIDECSTGEATCGPMQRCLNLPGGYTCNCPAGHRLVDDHECEDVDECKAAGNLPICSQNADCVNTIGSYQCRCHKGFRSAPVNDKVCVDVDECMESRAGSLCEQRCNNVWGGYRCSCHRGYRLHSDNRTCADVNECEEFKSKQLCDGKCINEPGSYRCHCPSGYRLSQNKRSCIDIDECETGEATCANAGGWSGTGISDICLNTRGGYRCHRIACPPGYQLESKNRCTKVDRVCPPADWDCAHQPSTYSYNFITFVSNLYIPASKVDLFTMRGPTWPNAHIRFQLRLVTVDAPPTVKTKADINSFLLVQAAHQGVVSLVRPLEGPQSIELELIMELYNQEQFGGIAVAKIFIYVSEYEF